MKIIENGKKTYTEFQNLFCNDVFRPKNSESIYIKIIQLGGLNAWGLTGDAFAFFHVEEEVELLDVELHINN